jgi:predicted helicase
LGSALIYQFLGELDRIKKMSGSLNEQTIRPAFRSLLRSWANSEDLFLLEEHEFQTKLKTTVYPDGTIVHDLRVPHGYWEAKDTKDDLDTEIAAKTSKGYPTSNIIFENSEQAVLYQHGVEVVRASMQDADALSRLLTLFFKYERPEIADFRNAVNQFKTDLPAVLDALRNKIDVAYSENQDFKEDADDFLAHAKDTINPMIGEADIREMLIQHILTEEIFNHVFNESDFHRENNIAGKLYELERKFFLGTVKHETLKGLEPYYAAIRSAAASITSHLEKQKFLKVIYENFYKVYNPKAADRLGVVYTPNEIVRFMIDGADWLCRQHFGRGLIDEKVNILDPCTGTGTFICELLESFRGDPKKLAHKYKHELHANEVAILPYYVANLNIEATYAAITGQYAEYPNLCFVDTLDNVAALGIRSGHQHDMFGAMSDENIERVKRQNQKTISVVIGNPPYNANQQNENDNNKNRTYKQIDEIIKYTYVKRSTAQKTKVYDMYSRFYRWATDRLGDEGVVAFITNRSFIDSRTFDGFRADVVDTFSDIYVVDLGGDVRANPKLSGTTHNVFGIQTGVAIAFMVKRRNRKKEKYPATIHYSRRPEMETTDDKLSFLAGTNLSSIKMEKIEPSKQNHWINQIENEWDIFLPIADKKTKAAKGIGQDRAIFKLTSQSMKTNRDEWVYAHSKSDVSAQLDYFLGKYKQQLNAEKLSHSNDTANLSDTIKWTRKLKRLLTERQNVSFNPDDIDHVNFRPYVKKFGYHSVALTEDLYQTSKIFDLDKKARYFSINRNGTPASTLAGENVPDYHWTGDSELFPRFRLGSSGNRVDNITDWALRKFQTEYGKSITKDDIFHYCYAVLHDPVYRETYAINLKREFPRIPFYPDFKQWVAWGGTLMDLHINYEDVDPWPLERVDVPSKRAEGSAPKAMLRSDQDTGTIRLDEDTQLTGVPKEAWQYKLGNRTAIDWVLDQHKEKTPRDPTIREKFNTYRFADYKEKVIDLLGRVTRVSVETVAITDAMKNLNRDGWDGTD